MSTPPKMETFDRLTAGEPMERPEYIPPTEEAIKAKIEEMRRVRQSAPTPLHDESTLDAMARGRDKSEIDIALDRLEGVAVELHALIDTFSERLEPVLIPADRLMDANSSEPQMATPLGSRIMERRHDVRYATRRLQSILERLAI